MSLVQHVSSMDGADREPEHDGDVLNRTDLSSREHVIPIQYEISYNVLDRQDQTRVKVADSAYRVSVTKRVGKRPVDGCSVARAFQKLTHLSPGNSGPAFLLDRSRCCIRLCCTETRHGK